MSAFRQLLRAPGIAPLAASSFVGRIPSAAAALALLTLLRAQPGGLRLGGAAVGLFGVGLALGQPALSRWADRFGQPRVLYPAGLASGAAFLALAIGPAGSAAWVLSCAGVAGAATPPLEPCLRALWPVLVPDDALLPVAYAFDAALIEVAFVLGPLAVVGAQFAGGGRGGVLVCAATVSIGTAVFASRPHTRRAGRAHGGRALVRSQLFTWAYLRLLIALAAAGLPVGALSVVVVDYADDHHQAGLAGLALSLNAVGALFGAWLAGRHPGRGDAPLGLALLCIGYLPLVVPLPPGPWLVACVVSGVLLPRMLAASFAEAQRVSPPERSTEASAWIITAFGAGAAVAAAGAGVIASSVAASARPITIGGYIVVGLVIAGITHRAGAGSGRAGERAAQPGQR